MSGNKSIDFESLLFKSIKSIKSNETIDCIEIITKWLKWSTKCPFVCLNTSLSTLWQQKSIVIVNNRSTNGTCQANRWYYSRFRKKIQSKIGWVLLTMCGSTKHGVVRLLIVPFYIFKLAWTLFLYKIMTISPFFDV